MITVDRNKRVISVAVPDVDKGETGSEIALQTQFEEYYILDSKGRKIVDINGNYIITWRIFN